MKKFLFVFLVGVSPVSKAQTVELDCDFNAADGSTGTHNVTIDLDKKTFKNGDMSFEPYEVEITNEFVSAEKFDFGLFTYRHTHQISRVTLSYVYAFGISNIPDEDPIFNRGEGQCEIVTRKRAF